MGSSPTLATINSRMNFATLYNLLETANFAKTSTTTLNKLDVIDWENQQLKRAMPTRGADETVIGEVVS